MSQEPSPFDPGYDHSKCYYWCGNPLCKSAPYNKGYDDEDDDVDECRKQKTETPP